jgi:hypothetical protein
MIELPGVPPAEVLGFILYVYERLLKYLRFDTERAHVLPCVQCEAYTTGRVTRYCGNGTVNKGHTLIEVRSVRHWLALLRRVWCLASLHI